MHTHSLSQNKQIKKRKIETYFLSPFLLIVKLLGNHTIHSQLIQKLMSRCKFDKAVTRPKIGTVPDRLGVTKDPGSGEGSITFKSCLPGRALGCCKACLIFTVPLSLPRWLDLLELKVHKTKDHDGNVTCKLESG